MEKRIAAPNTAKNDRLHGLSCRANGMGGSVKAAESSTGLPRRRTMVGSSAEAFVNGASAPPARNQTRLATSRCGRCCRRNGSTAPSAADRHGSCKSRPYPSTADPCMPPLAPPLSPVHRREIVRNTMLRDRSPRSAVRPDPQPPARLPGEPLEADPGRRDRSDRRASAGGLARTGCERPVGGRGSLTASPCSYRVRRPPVRYTTLRRLR